VLLFNAADRPRASYLRYDETGGWGGGITSRLTVKMVPGQHADLLADPTAAASIAEVIREHLRARRPVPPVRHCEPVLEHAASTGSPQGR
jgi:thioesterase domain-containing protein